MAATPALELDLECVHSSALDVAALALGSRRLALGGGAGPWPVGRVLQPELFEKLVPDEAMRNCISRSHFEFAWDSARRTLVLKRLSPNALLVSGAQVPQNTAVPISAGADIGLLAPTLNAPFLVFRLHVRGPGCLATPLPCPSAASVASQAHRPAEEYVFVCMFALGCDIDRIPLPLRVIGLRESGSLTIGRQHQPDFFERVLSAEQQRYLSLVSRSHLQVVAVPGQPGRFTFTNMSENPILVGEQQIVKSAQIIGQAPLIFSFVTARSDAPGTSCFLRFNFEPTGVVFSNGSLNPPATPQQPLSHQRDAPRRQSNPQVLASPVAASPPSALASQVPAQAVASPAAVPSQQQQPNSAALPAPYLLLCVFALDCDLGSLPKESRAIGVHLDRPVVVGRQHQPGFFESLLAKDPRHLACISRSHVELTPAGNGSFMVKNLSDNPIIVGATQLTKGMQHTVQPPSRIAFIAAVVDASATVAFLNFSLEAASGSPTVGAPAAGSADPRLAQAVANGAPEVHMQPSGATDAAFWLELGGSAVRADFPPGSRRVSGAPSGIVVGRIHQQQVHADGLVDGVAQFVSREHFRVDPGSQSGGFNLVTLASNKVWRNRAGVRVEARKNEPVPLANGDAIQLFTGSSDGTPDGPGSRGSLYWLFYDRGGSAGIDPRVTDNTVRMENTARLDQQPSPRMPPSPRQQALAAHTTPPPVDPQHVPAPAPPGSAREITGPSTPTGSARQLQSGIGSMQQVPFTAAPMPSMGVGQAAPGSAPGSARNVPVATAALPTDHTFGLAASGGMAAPGSARELPGTGHVPMDPHFGLPAGGSMVAPGSARELPGTGQLPMDPHFGLPAGGAMVAPGSARELLGTGQLPMDPHFGLPAGGAMVGPGSARELPGTGHVPMDPHFGVSQGGESAGAPGSARGLPMASMSAQPVIDAAHAMHSAMPMQQVVGTGYMTPGGMQMQPMGGVEHMMPGGMPMQTMGNAGHMTPTGMQMAFDPQTGGAALGTSMAMPMSAVPLPTDPALLSPRSGPAALGTQAGPVASMVLPNNSNAFLAQGGAEGYAASQPWGAGYGQDPATLWRTSDFGQDANSSSPRGAGGYHAVGGCPSGCASPRGAAGHDPMGEFPFPAALSQRNTMDKNPFSWCPSPRSSVGPGMQPGPCAAQTPQPFEMAPPLRTYERMFLGMAASQGPSAESMSALGSARSLPVSAAPQSRPAPIDFSLSPQEDPVAPARSPAGAAWHNSSATYYEKRITE